MEVKVSTVFVAFLLSEQLPRPLPLLYLVQNGWNGELHRNVLAQPTSAVFRFPTLVAPPAQIISGVVCRVFTSGRVTAAINSSYSAVPAVCAFIRTYLENVLRAFVVPQAPNSLRRPTSASLSVPSSGGEKKSQGLGDIHTQAAVSVPASDGAPLTASHEVKVIFFHAMLHIKPLELEAIVQRRRRGPGSDSGAARSADPTQYSPVKLRTWNPRVLNWLEGLDKLGNLLRPKLDENPSILLHDNATLCVLVTPQHGAQGRGLPHCQFRPVEKGSLESTVDGPDFRGGGSDGLETAGHSWSAETLTLWRILITRALQIRVHVNMRSVRLIVEFVTSRAEEGARPAVVTKPLSGHAHPTEGSGAGRSRKRSREVWEVDEGSALDGQSEADADQGHWPDEMGVTSAAVPSSPPPTSTCAQAPPAPKSGRKEKVELLLWPTGTARLATAPSWLLMRTVVECLVLPLYVDDSS